jgi:trimeric autotransporter adhesin
VTGDARIEDGGQATLTLLNNPSGVAVDASGNFFFTDRSRVHMVTTSTGVITTVAGNGTSGYIGDGGLAVLARLNSPTGVCVDGSGNIYIADALNNRIRLVTRSTGIINTVAGGGMNRGIGDGGLAASASVSFPRAVTVDASGNIYITDTYNHRIRMVTKSTGIITTVAGGGIRGYRGDNGQATSATLFVPSGVAVDASGNVYIADNYCIRMVTKSTGIITTVAGNGTRGYSGDGGLATAAKLDWTESVTVDASGNVYIADTYNHRIRMVTKSTGIITTVAGDGARGYNDDGGQATSASLNIPSGVAVDTSGNVYIADTDNNRIRMVTKSTGIITTVAGVSISTYRGDGGQAITCKLYAPRGIAFDASGDLYIADSLSNSIRMVTKRTGIITTVAGNGTKGYKADGGQARSSTTYFPNDVAVDASGNVYIADTYNRRIRMLTKSTGIITTVAGYESYDDDDGDGGQATSASLGLPSGVAVDASGNVYIADAWSNRIRMVTKSTGIITAVAGIRGLRGGYSGDGGLATSAKLNAPLRLALVESGNIYIADTWNNRIRMVTKSTGIINTVAGNGTRGYSGDGGLATLARLSIPSSIAVDASGNIYIADAGNNRIRMVTKSTGIISTVAGDGKDGHSGDGGLATSAHLSFPSGIAIDASGSIYVSDTYNDRIRILLLGDPSAASPTFSPSSSAVSTLSPSSSAASTLSPSSSAASTHSPSSSTASTLSPSSSAASTLSPSSSAASTLSPSSSAASTHSPSSSAASTLSPSASAASTLSPSSSAASTHSPSSSAASTHSPSSSAASTLSPSASAASTLSPSASAASTHSPSASVASTLPIPISTFVTSGSPGKAPLEFVLLSTPRPAMRLKCNAACLMLIRAQLKN